MTETVNMYTPKRNYVVFRIKSVKRRECKGLLEILRAVYELEHWVSNACLNGQSQMRDVWFAYIHNLKSSHK